MRIDLHTHSSVSDGTDTPSALVRRAKEAGLDVVALTDHDSVAGWDEAAEAGREHGIAVVPGIELSVTDTVGGVGRHLLAYRVDPSAPALAGILERSGRARLGRVPRMLQRCAEHGLAVDRDRLLADAGHDAPSRKHFAAELVRIGAAADEDDAFTRYLNEGGPLHVGRDRPTIEDAIDAVRAAGGVTVLAHPRDGKRGRGVDDTRLRDLRDHGLAGV